MQASSRREEGLAGSSGRRREEFRGNHKRREEVDVVSFLERAEDALFPRYWLFGLLFADDWGYGLLDLGHYWTASDPGCALCARNQRHLLVASSESIYFLWKEEADDESATRTLATFHGDREKRSLSHTVFETRHQKQNR